MDFCIFFEQIGLPFKWLHVCFLLQKGSQEYIDATDLLDLYYEIRDELLVETFGDAKSAMDDEDDEEPEDNNVNLEQIQVRNKNNICAPKIRYFESLVL